MADVVDLEKVDDLAFDLLAQGDFLVSRPPRVGEA
jgi:hypothetical protein